MTAYIQNNISRIESVIRENLTSSQLRELSDDVVSGFCKGKYLRSRLGLMLQQNLTGDIREDFYIAAGVVELVHSASLIHDDVIDAGEIRRGDPTWWRNHGSSSAVIIGDYLFCTAMELCSKIESEELKKTFATRIKEMCEGEFEQEFLHKNKRLNLAKCLDINRKKTGALFSIIAYAAAGDDKERAEQFGEAGFLTGTAYQLIDDLFDVFGDEEQIGKTLGTDERNKKATAVRLFPGRESFVLDKISELLDEAEKILESFPEYVQGFKSYRSICFNPFIKQLSDRIRSSETILTEKTV